MPGPIVAKPAGCAAAVPPASAGRSRTEKPDFENELAGLHTYPILFLNTLLTRGREAPAPTASTGGGIDRIRLARG